MRDQIIKHNQRLHKIGVRQEEILSDALTEDRGLSTEEKSELAKLETEERLLEIKVESLKRNQENYDQRQETRGGEAHRVEIIRDRSEVRPRPNGSGLSYRSLFYPESEVPRDGVFGDFREALYSIAKGDYVSRRAISGMSEAVGADGGFLLEPEYSEGIWNLLLESSDFMQYADVRPMESNELRVRQFNTRDHSSNIGGFSGAWLGEGGTMSAEKASIDLMSLRARKLIAMTVATRELLEDFATFDRDVIALLITALKFYLDGAILSGDGAAKPLGVLNSPSLITIAKEGGQSAATVLYANLINAEKQLLPESQKSAIWVCAPSVREQLRKLYITPSSDDLFPRAYVTENGQDLLLGRPVVFSEHCEALGTAGDVYLVDFSRYVVGVRKHFAVERSASAYWTTDQFSFRVVGRFDGKAQLASSVTLKNAEIVSWALAIADRA